MALKRYGPLTHQSIGRSVTSEQESASCDPSLAVTQVNVSARAARRGIDVSERLYVLHDTRLGKGREDLSLLCTVLQVGGLAQGCGFVGKLEWMVTV